MIVIGIDPGIGTTGYAVVCLEGKKCRIVDLGYIKVPQDMSFSARLCVLYEKMSVILDKFSPDVVVFEEIYSHSKFPYTSVIMGHARGVLLLASGFAGSKTEMLSATRVKKAITGRGNASKEQVQRFLSKMYKRKDVLQFPLDTSDALALATGYILVKLGDGRYEQTFGKTAEGIY